MSDQAQPRAKSFLVSFLIATAVAFAANDPALAQSRKKPPSINPTAEVNMIRQDQSDCTNSTVVDNPSLVGGTAYITRDNSGNTNVEVGISASPNTTYNFYLKCVKQLGTIVTGDEGAGIATFSFPTNSVGNVYAFDMYPNGAPPGNKFQSVQVNIK
jgi:hypothetical protein